MISEKTHAAETADALDAIETTAQASVDAMNRTETEEPDAVEFSDPSAPEDALSDDHAVRDRAVRFKLEVFEGPLDLLLALIAKNKINIYDIPISLILEQYLAYIRQMEQFNLDIASSFIVMAARLMQIKSRLLLPVQAEEEDPRQELVDQLLEYRLAKETAALLHTRELCYGGRMEKPAEKIDADTEYRLTHDVSLLTEALRRVLSRADDANDAARAAMALEESLKKHLGAARSVSVNEKILFVLKRLVRRDVCRLDSFFDDVKSRGEIVATFLALLELVKSRRVHVAYRSGYADCDIVLDRNAAE